MSREVVVPPARLERWFTGFVERNGALDAITSSAQSTTVTTIRGAIAVLPERSINAPTLPDLVSALLTAGTAVIVLVRRGGYGIARVAYSGGAHEVIASKTGTRYVQGRTAAGGQSQQRFARRRANQATALTGAATAAARTVLGDDPAPVDLLVTGGDQPLIAETLAARPLQLLRATRAVHVQVGEPRRRTVDEAIEAARSVRILVTNAPTLEDP